MEKALESISETDQQDENISFEDDDTGIEKEDTSSEAITEPFDPTKIRMEQKILTVDLILNRIREGVLDLFPDFQRRPDIWSDEAQSRLIESMLIRIPIPAFYIDATIEDHWLVVDGLQRLNSLKRFVIDKELRLCGLEFLAAIQGKSYDELSPTFKRRILETQFIFYMIAEGTPDNAKFIIFKRINTGGLPLSPQEIRHALNQGKSTKLLARLAASEEFKNAHNKSIKDKRMEDQECVLRFMAFTLSPYTDYKTGNLDIFLHETMSKINNLSDTEIEKLERQFLQAMVAAREIFGDNAFRKIFKRDGRRSLINRALFEAWSVNLGKLDDKQIQILIQKQEELIDKFIELMNVKGFNNAISQATGDIGRVKTRFGEVERIIKGVLSS